MFNTIIKESCIPIYSWCKNLDYKTLEQALNSAKLPMAFDHVCLMPDAHYGYGVPIGCVLALKDAICPNAVGVDIGCGISLAQTDIKVCDISTDDIKKIMCEIRKEIPIGFEHRKEKSFVYPFGMYDIDEEDKSYICVKEADKAAYQIGTLGGGNHFIELQKNSSGNLCCMIHSGSRNLGKKVCDHYNNLAKELNKKWYPEIDQSIDLSVLPLGEDITDRYIKEMYYCTDFAKLNRNCILNNITRIILNHFKIEDININEIDSVHNYARFSDKEKDFFDRREFDGVIIHRKGAVYSGIYDRNSEISFDDNSGSYKKIDLDYLDSCSIYISSNKNLAVNNEVIEESSNFILIPGSQGSKSYIVKGKGNIDSFCSCSHGAGRSMSRGEAKKNLNLSDQIKKMNDLGIIHGIRNKDDLEEAPDAYKNIDEVMDAQKDLIDVVDELTPIANIKG